MGKTAPNINERKGNESGSNAKKERRIIFGNHGIFPNILFTFSTYEQTFS